MSDPSTPALHACWSCTWWDGMGGQGNSAQCAHGGRLMAHSQPERGCAYWEREPGSDDEPLTKEQMHETWKHVGWPEPSLRGRQMI